MAEEPEHLLVEGPVVPRGPDGDALDNRPATAGKSRRH